MARDNRDGSVHSIHSADCISPIFVNVFRQGIAVLLVAWLTIVGHLAVAMPFCERVSDQKAMVAQDDHQHTAQVSWSSYAIVDKSQQGCAQHQGHGGNKRSLACDACGMCHMACHALPPVACGVTSALPNRVYSYAPPTGFVSFVPELPQPIPLNTLV
jgi:hypothetical protein